MCLSPKVAFFEAVLLVASFVVVLVFVEALCFVVVLWVSAKEEVFIAVFFMTSLKVLLVLNDEM